MPDLGLAFVVAVCAFVVIGGGYVIWRLTSSRGLHEAPRGGDVLDLLPGVPADRFTPGVVVPFTPQLGEPLKPLPTTDVPGPVARGVRHEPAGSGPGTLHLVADEIDQLMADVKARFGLDQPEPEPRSETVDEKYERLFPRTVPAWAAEHVNFHTDNADMVESMFTRAQADQVRALANGQVPE